MKNVANLFEDFLRGRDLRLTKQRAEILKAIYATHRHVTADELYEMLRENDSTRKLKISRATVYRTLALLTEGGFIQPLDLGRDQGALYEHVLGHEHHDHLICQHCGKIQEFHDEELEVVQERAVKRHGQGFVSSSHRLTIHGTCGACARKGKSSPAPEYGAEVHED